MSTKGLLVFILTISVACLMGLIAIFFLDSLEDKKMKEIENHRIAQQIMKQAEEKKKLSGSKVLIDPKNTAVNNSSSTKDTIKSKDEYKSSSKVFIADKTYPVEKGQTFYMDKGLLKLYACIDLVEDVMYFNGEEYHNGGQLTDGTINEELKFDPESRKFTNKSGTIIVSDYDGLQFKIEDKRTGICLPFNGVLVLLQD